MKAAGPVRYKRIMAQEGHALVEVKERRPPPDLYLPLHVLSKYDFPSLWKERGLKGLWDNLNKKSQGFSK